MMTLMKKLKITNSCERRSLEQNSKIKMKPLTSATKMESNDVVFAKMSLMTLMTSLKEDQTNG